MCFSATSSFVIAGCLLFTTALALQTANQKKLIPLCLIPLGFAIQQASEGVIWLTLAKPNSLLHLASLYTYLIFAFVIWPLWMPFALKVYESNPTKKMLLTLCQLIGLLFAIAALFFLVVSKPIIDTDSGNLAYKFHNTFFGATTGLLWYAIPVVLPFLLVSNKFIVTFLGKLGIVTLIATYFFAPEGLISVWCYIAATLSILVLGLVWSEADEN